VNPPKIGSQVDPFLREKPLRALSPGLHMGLSILLDVQEDEYFCSGTESVGFKVVTLSYITFPWIIKVHYSKRFNTSRVIFKSKSEENEIFTISTNILSCISRVDCILKPL